MPKGLPISYIKKWGISKLAWKKFRAGALTKGVPTRTASIKKRLKGEKSMARRRYFPRRRSRRGGMTIPLAPVFGLVANQGDTIMKAMSGAPLDKILDSAVFGLTGYSLEQRRYFGVQQTVTNLTPLIIGLLVHKFVGGRPLNFNGMLARAKVPFIRI